MAIATLGSTFTGRGIWLACVLAFVALLGALVFAVAAWVLLFTGGTEQRRRGARTLLAHLPFLRHR
ncbi:hypothetical protein ACWC4D_19145 [Streptomyces sp. NPDC001288]|uniref:hypothetical protein n=1 Tax=Streptomyces sp. NPDC001297 TaxID=3364559 RepID=UPI0036A647C5